MNDLKSRLLSISVTLILTGIIGRLAPENSNKSLIRFIITAVIFLSIFSSGPVNDSFFINSDFTKVSYSDDRVEEEVGSIIKSELQQKITEKTDTTVKKYSPSAVASVIFKDDSMLVRIKHNGDMPDDAVSSFEDEMLGLFEGKIIFDYTVVKE